MTGVGRDLKDHLVATCFPASVRITQGREKKKLRQTLDFFSQALAVIVQLLRNISALVP